MKKLGHAIASIGFCGGSLLLLGETLQSGIEDYSTRGETRTLETGAYFVGSVALLGAAMREGLRYNDLRLEEGRMDQRETLQD